MHTPALTGPVATNPSGNAQEQTSAGGDANPGARAGHNGDSSPHGQNSSSRHRQNKNSRQYHIPDRRALLATLAQLPNLIAKKIITPAEANSMRATIETLLDELRQETGRAQGTSFDPSTVQDALREHPELLRALQPLMSDEELRFYADEETDAEHEQQDGGGEGHPSGG